MERATTLSSRRKTNHYRWFRLCIGPRICHQIRFSLWGSLPCHWHRTRRESNDQTSEQLHHQIYPCRQAEDCISRLGSRKGVTLTIPQPPTSDQSLPSVSIECHKRIKSNRVIPPTRGDSSSILPISFHSFLSLTGKPSPTCSIPLFRMYRFLCHQHGRAQFWLLLLVTATWVSDILPQDIQPPPYQKILRKEAFVQPLEKILFTADTVTTRLPSWDTSRMLTLPRLSTRC